MTAIDSPSWEFLDEEEDRAALADILGAIDEMGVKNNPSAQALLRAGQARARIVYAVGSESVDATRLAVMEAVASYNAWVATGVWPDAETATILGKLDAMGIDRLDDDGNTFGDVSMTPAERSSLEHAKAAQGQIWDALKGPDVRKTTAAVLAAYNRWAESGAWPGPSVPRPGHPTGTGWTRTKIVLGGVGTFVLVRLLLGRKVLG